MGCCKSRWRRAPGEAEDNKSDVAETGSLGSTFSSNRRAHHQALRATKHGGIGHGNLCIDNPGDVHDFYTMEKVQLGEGAYGTVRKCTRKGTACRLPRACKQISIAQIGDMEIFENEIAIMRIMDHPNICKLYESFDDRRYIYLVMELCEGGELFDKIIANGHFSEFQAAVVMQQVFRAIRYIHALKICHRDLKCENFLLQKDDIVEKNLLKVIDFGLATRFKEGKEMKTKCGSCYYAAPEVQAGRYTEKCDLWSLGCILFVLLCGYPPFYGGDDKTVLKKTRRGNVVFKPDDWQNVSEDAKNLVRWLLKLDINDRLSAEQALHHTWVEKRAPEAKEPDMDASVVTNMRAFNRQNKLKKATLHIVANQMNEENLTNLREGFIAMNTNGDGLLTIEELSAGIKKSCFNEVPPDFKQIIRGIDSDGSGVIDYTEFLAAAIEKKEYEQESVLREAFRVFDVDGDGLISMEELRAVIGDDCEPDQDMKTMVEIMREVGHSTAEGSYEINFQEFQEMMRGAQTRPNSRARSKDTISAETISKAKRVVAGAESKHQERSKETISTKATISTEIPEPSTEVIQGAKHEVIWAEDRRAEDTDGVGITPEFLELPETEAMAWAENILAEPPLRPCDGIVSAADIVCDLMEDDGCDIPGERGWSGDLERGRSGDLEVLGASLP